MKSQPTFPKGHNPRVDVIRGRAKLFAETNGRRPRILLGRTGDGSFDADLKAIAASLANLGFDVDILGLIKTPPAAARIAVENDVHFMGVVGVCAESCAFLGELLSALDAAGGGVQVVAWRLPVSGPGSRLPIEISRRVELMDLAGDPTQSADRMLAILSARCRDRSRHKVTSAKRISRPPHPR